MTSNSTIVQCSPACNGFSLLYLSQIVVDILTNLVSHPTMSDVKWHGLCEPAVLFWQIGDSIIVHQSPYCDQ